MATDVMLSHPLQSYEPLIGKYMFQKPTILKDANPLLE